MNNLQVEEKRNVLLTYGWCRTAYVSLKSLAAKGLNVYVADFSATAMCKFSNLKKEFIKMPSWIENEEDYIDFITRVIKKYQIDVFIPVNEEIFTVAKYRDRFPAKVKIPIEKYEKLMKVHNKREATEHAVKNNMLVKINIIIIVVFIFLPL